jgi:glycosyltransferase involved in cell wall biosynthesis
MNGAPWGGSEELWYRSALALTRSGVKTGCAVYGWKEKEKRLQELEAAGCRAYRLPNRDRSKKGLSRLIDKQKNNSELKRAIQELPLKEYKTVVINQGGFEVVSPPWQKFYEQLDQYVLLFHNYDESQKFSVNEKNILSEWMTRSKANLFAAQKMKEVIETQLNFKISKASVFLNPITFKPPTTETPYPATDSHYIFSVFAALDIKRKAQSKLIWLLSSEKWKERPIILNIYGEGKDKAQLQQLIDKSSLGKRVFLKGHISDVPAAMKETHLVLQLSDIDAMPLSVVEAMAMSRPLVVTRVGDMPLWVRENENGWVSGTDPGPIDETLENAWQSRARWSEMGKASFRIFRDKFPDSAEQNFITNYL